MTDRTIYVVREGEKKADDENKNLTTLLIHAKTRYRDQAKERCEQKGRCYRTNKWCKEQKVRKGREAGSEWKWLV